MEQYIIKGGNPLVGEVEIGGAKNAALGILAAAIMADEPVLIENLPDVNDINVMLEAIEGIGAMVQRIDRHTVKINGNTIGDFSIDYDYIIQGQDFDAKEIKRTLKIKALPNGRVEAQFNNFDSKSIVHYVLTCQNNRCLIDDIIEQDETRKQPKNSFKQSVRQCLRTQFPKISPPKK